MVAMPSYGSQRHVEAEDLDTVYWPCSSGFSSTIAMTTCTSTFHRIWSHEVDGAEEHRLLRGALGD